MNSHTIAFSPQTYARTGGIIYLFIIVAAAFGEMVVRGSLIDWSDVGATATAIRASETLFRAGLAAELLTCACDVIMALILYVLLRPVSRNLALLGAMMRLVFVGVYAVTKLFEVAALVTLGDASHLPSFTAEQLQSLAYISLRVHSLGYGASLLFFGACCIIFGYLIRKSGYLPWVLGLLLEIAGAGYVVFSLAQILSPAMAARYLFPWLMLPAFVAELGLALWLTVKVVDLSTLKKREPAVGMA